MKNILVALLVVVFTVTLGGCSRITKTVTVIAPPLSTSDFIGGTFKHLDPLTGFGGVNLPKESRAGIYQINFYGYPGVIGDSELGLKAFVYGGGTPGSSAATEITDPATYFKNLIASGSVVTNTWGQLAINTPIDSAMQVMIWNPSANAAVNAQYEVIWRCN